jgi:rare lipoprotein A
MFGMTAAHRTLPLGSFIKVIHAKTRKSVVVKINDRGPYIAGRSLDLSLGAANELGILHEGVAPVIIEKVKNEKKMGRLNN